MGSSAKTKKSMKIDLLLECEKDELTPEQMAYYDGIHEEFTNFQTKLKDYIAKFKGELITAEGDYSAFQIPFSCPPKWNEDVLFKSSTSSLEPVHRRKRIITVRQLPSETPPSTPAPSRPRRGRNQETTPPPASPPIAPVPIKAAAAPTSSFIVRQNASGSKVSLSGDAVAEFNALGGLLAGTKGCAKQTQGGIISIFQNNDGSDSCEYSFGKQQTKTFPSLMVFARAHLTAPNLQKSAQERSKLDTLVKNALVHPPNKFIEWLLQKGLIRTEHECPLHVNPDGTPVKLKLGLYSDISKFPYSGGYVWVSECCPSNFVSVFHNSIFERSTVTPQTNLKLLYHWACQTNVQNVMQWVRVDSLYIKNFYTIMRAVCTQALRSKLSSMGGRGRQIEVGVFTIGTSDAKISAKIEVLGVLDWEAKIVRLSVPEHDVRSVRQRWQRILEPLTDWVHKDSIIIIDSTIDLDALITLGFRNVRICQPTEVGGPETNANILCYLRKVIPRMFQNTLHYLTRPIIQQFLDELTWRECFGRISANAFHNICTHLAEQTALNFPVGLLWRLTQLAANPFTRRIYVTTGTREDAEQPAQPPSPPLVNLPSKRRKRQQMEQIEAPLPAKKPNLSWSTLQQPETGQALETPADVDLLSPQWWIVEPRVDIPEYIKDYLETEEGVLELEGYYYGMLPGVSSHEKKVRVLMKCCICSKPFWDSMVLMKHLLLHCQMKPTSNEDIRKVVQCNQCFLSTNSLAQLKQHTQLAHAPPQNQTLICRICEKIFPDKVNLLYHMHRFHTRMELPYCCGVCKHRSSSYKQVVEHFTQIHKGSHLLFCPYCLKVINLLKNRENNLIYYVNHIAKHKLPDLAKKCPSCRLSFFSRGLLQQHFEVDHSSFCDEPGVIAFSSEFSAKMPPPSFIELVALTAPSQTNLLTSMYTKKAISVSFNVPDELACVECEASMNMEGHFSQQYSCGTCKFNTNCQQAILEHISINHKPNKLLFLHGKTVLEERMFCLCGYNSSSGDQLAKHLVSCDKRIVYPTEASAKSVVADLRRMDRAKLQIRMKETEETHGMLNVLGLMRKSPEPEKDMDVDIDDEDEDDDDDERGTEETEVLEEPRNEEEVEEERIQTSEKISVNSKRKREISEGEEEGEKLSEGTSLNSGNEKETLQESANDQAIKKTEKTSYDTENLKNEKELIGGSINDQETDRISEEMRHIEEIEKEKSDRTLEESRMTEKTIENEPEKEEKDEEQQKEESKRGLERNENTMGNQEKEPGESTDGNLIAEKEVGESTGSLIAELEGMIYNNEQQTTDASDFIADLIGE